MTVELARRTDDGDRWAVRRSGREAMNSSGGWEYEPLPSSRSDEFLARTRFDLETAWTLAKGASQ